MSVDDVLDGMKRLILEEERYYLCQYLDPANYFAYLRSKFIINEDDQALIESKIGRRKRAEQMIDILLQKGGESYDVLTKAIQLNKTQKFLVEKLQKEYEKRKSNYMALMRGQESGDNTIPISTMNLPKPVSNVKTLETNKGDDLDSFDKCSHISQEEMLRKCKRLHLENKQKAAHNAVNKNKQQSNISDCSASNQQTIGTSNVPAVVHQIYNRTGSDQNMNIHINNQEPPILNKRQSQSSYPSEQDSFKQSIDNTSHCVPVPVQYSPLINMSCLSDKQMLIPGRCYKASDNN